MTTALKSGLIIPASDSSWHQHLLVIFSHSHCGFRLHCGHFVCHIWRLWTLFKYFILASYHFVHISLQALAMVTLTAQFPESPWVLFWAPWLFWCCWGPLWSLSDLPEGTKGFLQTRPPCASGWGRKSQDSLARHHWGGVPQTPHCL